MPAAVVTSHTLEDSFHIARFLFTGSISDTQESAVVKVDVSELAYALGDTQTVSVESLKWNTSGAGTISVIQGSTTVALLSGDGSLHGGDLGAPGGDVKFTTAGFSNATYQVEVTVRRHDGFSLAAHALEATLDEDTYVTDDLITASVEFSQPVFVKGVPVLELDINGETVEMLCETPNNTEVTTVDFAYVVLEGDQAEAGDLAFGDIILRGSASIAGGFGAASAILTGFESDLSAVTFNAEE